MKKQLTNYLRIPLVTILFLCTSTISAQEVNPIIKSALSYLYTPYVPHTLDINNTEDLIINKKEVDCTTFVEYVLAESLAKSERNVDNLTEEDYLTRIRYRNGIINGYPSRIHYTSEWIKEGVMNGYIQDLTQLFCKDSMYVALSYMTDHPSYYKHLQNSPENVAAMKEIEQNASGQLIRYLPKDKLPNQGLFWIKDGDIICFTVGVYGLDISHMGFAYYKQNQLHLLHASYPIGKVVIDPLPISEMLKNNKRWTGIRVLRPNI